MQIEFKQNLDIYLDTPFGRKLYHFKKGISEMEEKEVNYLISEGFAESKSLNPVIENKAITNLDNKSLEDMSVEDLRKYAKLNKIKFHPFFGKEKLLKIIMENK